MSPVYRGFTLTAFADGWRYRHLERPEIAGTCPSLIGCVREIDELCQPPVVRMMWPILGMLAGAVGIYVAIWWVLA